MSVSFLGSYLRKMFKREDFSNHEHLFSNDDVGLTVGNSFATYGRTRPYFIITAQLSFISPAFDVNGLLQNSQTHFFLSDTCFSLSLLYDNIIQHKFIVFLKYYQMLGWFF